MMKRCIFLFLITSMIVSPIQSNEIHDAMQHQYDEIVSRHIPLLEKQRALVKELSHTWSELLFTDKERDAHRQSFETKQLFRDFSVENSQVLGIMVCKECLEAIPNPDVLDVGTCYGKWLKSRDREESRRIAALNDTGFGYDNLCENGLDEGDRQFREFILAIMKENFKKQNG